MLDTKDKESRNTTGPSDRDISKGALSTRHRSSNNFFSRSDSVNKLDLSGLMNNSQLENDGNLSFEEDDPLMNKTKTQMLDNSFDKNPKGQLDKSLYAGTTNMESESQLSMRHLSEGGRAMRTTGPLAS